MAREVAEELLKHGKIVRGWLGIYMDIADRKDKGVAILAVQEGSPAAAGGLAKGDRLLVFDGHSGFTPDGLRRIVAKTLVGKTVDVVVLRRGKRLTLRIKIGRLK